MKPSLLARFTSFCLIPLLFSACFLFTPQGAKTVLAVKDIACVIEHAYLDDAALNKLCEILTAEQQILAKEIASSHRTAMAKKLASSHAEACSDAGDAQAADASSEAVAEPGDAGMDSGLPAVASTTPNKLVKAASKTGKDGGAK